MIALKSFSVLIITITCLFFEYIKADPPGIYNHTDSLSLSVPINIAVTSSNITCHGMNNGSINITVSGGTPPYSYTWTDGSYSEEIIEIGATKDNSIYESNVNNSNGTGEYLPVGQTGFGFNTRALLAFNIRGSLPANSQVTSATLKMHQSLSSGSSGIQNMELHRLTQDWGEGLSNAGSQAGNGAPATTSDATWSFAFYPSIPWIIPGSAFSSIVSASTSVEAPGFYIWSSPGLAADIQYWIDNPSEDYGWLLKGLETGPLQGKRFDSRENGSPVNRPALTIHYQALSVISTLQNLSNLVPGTYNVIVTDANGNTATTSATITEPDVLCSSTLHLKLFLEGFYQNGSMVPMLYNSGLTLDSNIVDTITVELHFTDTPFSIYKSQRASLHIHGEAEVVFDGITYGTDYFVAVKHRNSIETWSKVPVTMTSSVIFDFSSP